MSTSGSLAGQRVVIVGGSAGIGLAVAEQAMREGASIVIGSHDAERLGAALAGLGTNAQAFPVDVADASSVGRFFAACGPIDHLAYTAGDWKRRSTVLGRNFSMADAQESFEVRFWGLLRAIDAALPHLSDTGSITLTGGLLAHRPQAGQALSSAVTGAVEHLGLGLAIDLAPRRVNIVVPGLIATEVWSRMPSETLEAMVKGQPIPRIGTTEEVAEAYVGFMRSTYTTGQSLIVDGGMLYR